MDNIREIVSKNMIALRKAKGLTQVELSKYVNYSDKAISRWEKGEVQPDYEVLMKLSELYNVNIGYFFEEHDNVDVKMKNRSFINQLFLSLLSAFSVYSIMTIIFVYEMIYKKLNAWELFVLGVPITCFILIIINMYVSKNKIVSFTCFSVLLWSTLTVIYLRYLELNLWLIYVVGVPIQASLVFIYLISKGIKKNLK